MTTCQRCAGNLKYTIMAYDGYANQPVTIDKTCEPCINQATQALEAEADYLLRVEAGEIHVANDGLNPARGCTYSFIFSIVCGIAIAATLIISYLATH